ncbi:hypothetical protein REPUB_Repub06bG0094200 [Reevesia pubescens]
MAQLKLFSFLLFAVLVLSFGMSSHFTTVDGGICCKEHPEFGRCLPGHEDEKCQKYCIQECRGGFCKQMSNGHHECHCYC